MPRILLVEPNSSTLSYISTLLRQEGYDVEPALNEKEAIPLLEKFFFELVIADMSFHDYLRQAQLNILHSTQEAKTLHIVSTEDSLFDHAIHTIGVDAFSFVVKPLHQGLFLSTVKQALSFQRTLAENVQLAKHMSTEFGTKNLVCESPAMKQVHDTIKQITSVSNHIFIEGEVGTGKEFVSKIIHTQSSRHHRPFIPIHCSLLNEDILEKELFGTARGGGSHFMSANPGVLSMLNGGTLFLKDIGHMPRTTQESLLAFINKDHRKNSAHISKGPDIRIISSSKDSLHKLVEQGSLLNELATILSSITLHMPSLRDRREDIYTLAEHIIHNDNPETYETIKFDPKAIISLEQYGWPGNVSELENIIRYAYRQSDKTLLVLEDFPREITSPSNLASSSHLINHQGDILPLTDFIEEQEQAYVRQVIDYMGGDKLRAANILQTSMTTLYRKLRPAKYYDHQKERPA